MRGLVAVALSGLLFAGCSGKPEADVVDDHLDSFIGDQNQTVLNLAPIPTLTADLVNGTLNVTFALDATDANADPLNWTLDVDGNGVADQNGTDLPVEINHTYAEPGVFNVTFSVSDGTLTSVSALIVNITAPLNLTVPGILQAFQTAWDGPDNPRCAGQVAPYDATGLAGQLYVEFAVDPLTWGKAFTADFASFTVEDYILFVNPAGDVLLEVAAGAVELNWGASGTVPQDATTGAFYGCGAAQGETVDYAAGDL